MIAPSFDFPTQTSRPSSRRGYGAQCIHLSSHSRLLHVCFSCSAAGATPLLSQSPRSRSLQMTSERIIVNIREWYTQKRVRHIHTHGDNGGRNISICMRSYWHMYPCPMHTGRLEDSTDSLPLPLSLSLAVCVYIYNAYHALRRMATRPYRCSRIPDLMIPSAPRSCSSAERCRSTTRDLLLHARTRQSACRHGPAPAQRHSRMTQCSHATAAAGPGMRGAETPRRGVGA